MSDKIYTLPNGGAAFRALKPFKLTPEELDDHAQYAADRVQGLLAKRRQQRAYKRPSLADDKAFLVSRKRPVGA